MARWHDQVDDPTLLRLYQQASRHLTLFRDFAANNALVESLACGLPIVTNDRGSVLRLRGRHRVSTRPRPLRRRPRRTMRTLRG